MGELGGQEESRDSAPEPQGGLVLPKVRMTPTFTLESRHFFFQRSAVFAAESLSRVHFIEIPSSLGFPCGSDSKEFACNAGDLGLIPGLGGSHGGGNGSPLQYFCLKNPMGRGAWQVESTASLGWTQLKGLHEHTHTHTHTHRGLEDFIFY